MKDHALKHSELLELLDYNPLTGLFTWLKYRSQIARKGDVAGSIKDNGYRYIRINNKAHRANRLAFFYVNGYFSDKQIDHKDRIRDNNKWKNLVEKTPSENSKNRGLRSDNKSGIPGVAHVISGKWTATVADQQRKRKHLGTFLTKDEAIIARWKGEIKYNYPNTHTTSEAYLYLKGKGLIWN